MEPSFGYLVANVGRLLRKLFEQQSAQFGVSLAQGRALLMVARHEGINQARLADMLETQPISLARLLDRMEAAGWVERRPDPADRRVHRLYLSAKAHPVLDRIEETVVATRAEAFAALSPAEQDQLMQLLVRVHGTLCKRDCCAPTVSTSPSVEDERDQ